MTNTQTQDSQAKPGAVRPTPLDVRRMSDRRRQEHPEATQTIPSHDS